MTDTAVQSAISELAALAARMREDWDEAEIGQAVEACQSAGWRHWEIALELVRLAITKGSKPGDLGKGRSRGSRKPAGLAAVRKCAVELTALALKMRPDWTARDVHAALKACHDAGWPVAQAALELVRLTVIHESEPRDLTAAAQTPYARWSFGDRRG